MGGIDVRKIFLIASLTHKEPVLELLQNLGVLEIKEIETALKNSASTALPEEKILIRLETAVKFLEVGRKKTLLDSFIGEQQIEISSAEYQKITQEYDYQTTIQNSEKLAPLIIQNQEKQAHGQSKISELSPWVNLNSPLDILNKLEKVVCRTVIFSEEGAQKFADEIKTISLACYEIVSQKPSEIYALVVSSRSQKEKIERILSDCLATVISLPELAQTPAEAIKNWEAEAVRLKKEESALQTERDRLKKDLVKLKIIYDFFYQKIVMAEAEKKIGRTVATFVLEGWIESHNFGILRQKIAAITNQFELVPAPVLKIETPPVVLANKKFLVPFEIITRMFGAPNHSETDPTPILAVFFIIFFGICLGDAGYGIMLILMAGWILRKIKMPAGGQSLVKLLLYGGVATFIAGALTGSWFGLDFETVRLPLAVKKIILSVKVIDIFKSPMIFLYFSFFLGIVQIFTGLAISLFNCLKNKDYQAAFLDNVSWICFLAGLIAFGLSKAGNSSLGAPAGYFTLFWAAFLILTQGRHKRTWPEKFWSGLLSLYKTSGFLGDMLSYSRLLALGMCSSVIAMVVNILSVMVKDSVPVLGIILMILIFVVGHFFNFILSILSAFIHSMRLQLVEFFGKFFQGGGRFFKPFQKESKYIKILEEV